MHSAVLLSLIHILILVLVVVGGVALGAGIGGQLVGFYPIESSITCLLYTSRRAGIRLRDPQYG